MKRCLPLLLVAMTGLLSACGFHLRGSSDNGQFAVREMALSSPNAYGDMTRDVRRLLEDGGVRISNRAPWKLVLGEQKHSSRTASYKPNTRAAELELTSSLNFAIQSSDGVLLYSDTLEVQKTQVTDESNLAGSSREADLLRSEMRRELLQQLNMRLHHLTPEQLEAIASRARAAGAATR